MRLTHIFTILILLSAIAHADKARWRVTKAALQRAAKDPTLRASLQGGHSIVLGQRSEGHTFERLVVNQHGLAIESGTVDAALPPPMVDRRPVRLGRFQIFGRLNRSQWSHLLAWNIAGRVAEPRLAEPFEQVLLRHKWLFLRQRAHDQRGTYVVREEDKTVPGLRHHVSEGERLADVARRFVVNLDILAYANWTGDLVEKFRTRPPGEIILVPRRADWRPE